MKRDDRPVTQMPHVDPKVAAVNPSAAAYAARVAGARYAEPRGGGAAPPIPLLNAPHQDGMTMADQATAMRGPPPGAPAPAGTIFTPEAAAQHIAQPAGPGLLTNDTLPEMAKQDPMYREGHGAMYAVNQPGLAKKYGVIRGGKHIPPQALQTGRPGLSEKSVEGLAALQQFQKTRQAAESGDASAEAAAEEGLAGQAARVANPSGSGDAKPVTDEQKAEAERALRGMDEFDFNSFREIMMKDLVNNESERTAIESRLSPLDLSELIMKGRVSQLIPINPGKYEPVFQSFTGEDELALKRLLMLEKKGLEAPDRYLLDKFQLMTVALGLVKVNTTILPSHLDPKGDFNDEMFWAKFNRVLKLPFHMLASLGVNYYWFDVRVRKLFLVERLKNG